MDPNAMLEEILYVVKYRNDLHPEFDYSSLLDAISNLDEWLSKGGFLPERWER